MREKLPACLCVVVVVLVGGCGEDSTDKPGQPTEICPNGTMTEGKGCALPCEEGWQNSEGSCHVECPPMSSPGPDGKCVTPACPEGWLEGGKDGPLCVPGCPPGFELDQKAGGTGCRLPCPEGFSKGEDGWCHLDCAASMEPAEGLLGCELPDAGAAGPCPQGKWAEDEDMASAIFVDAGAESGEQADGSKEHPFATINDAVLHTQEAGTEEVSIYVAAGDYHEVVKIEGVAKVKLVGACASKTSLVGEETGMLPVETEEEGDLPEIPLGAVSILGAETVEVRGMTISSDGAGVRVRSKALSSGASSVSIRDMAVEKAAWSGLAVSGTFSEVVVDACSVSAAVASGIVVNAEKSPGVAGDSLVTVRRNLVTQMEHCSGFEFCDEYSGTIGISILGAAKATVERNAVSDFDQAVGIVAYTAGEAIVNENLLNDLAGQWGISVEAPTMALSGNRVAAGWKGDVFTGDNAGFHALSLGASLESGSGQAVVSRNLVSQVAGYGLFAVAEEGDSLELTVDSNEFLDVAAGVLLTGAGSLAMSGNRVARARMGAFVYDTGNVSITGNEFREGVLCKTCIENRAEGEAVAKSTNNLLVLGTASSGGTIVFAGNHVTGQVSLGKPEDFNGAVHLDGADSITVQGNVFEKCTAEGLAQIEARGDALVEGNLFVGLDSIPSEEPNGRAALGIIAPKKSGPSTILIRRNLFQHFMTGWMPEDGNAFTNSLIFMGDGIVCEVTENVFWNTLISDFSPLDGAVPARIAFSGNLVRHGIFFFRSVRQLEIEQNVMDVFAVALISQPEGCSASVRGNSLDRGTLLLTRPEGSTTIEDNEFARSSGAGVVVASSTGTVEVVHNLFSRVDPSESLWGGTAGVIADAVQVAGTTSSPCSGATIAANRFSNCYRSGLIVSGSSSQVEGNSFDETCPFYIQNEPSKGAVSGSDTAYAVVPESPLGVILAEELQ